VPLRLPGELTAAGVDATAFAAALTAEGIPAKPIFPPWQRTPAYRAAGLRDTPEAAFAARSVVALPHQMLLEPAACADAAAALEKITRDGVPELLAWQERRLAGVAS
jgi:3-amino-5-hydroxybenzoate synthase